jgi:pyruvate/2-oxoglutarate dehydrogenase complex dihydrolipoamide acyltransferase (E2) component
MSASSTVRTRSFPRQRLHTLYFLEAAQRYRPVFLDTTVDMTAVVRHRETAPQRCGYLSYIVQAAARTLRDHDGGNTMLLDGRRPRLAHFPDVTAKITLDKRMDGVRIVVSGLIQGADDKDVSQIQQDLDALKAQDPATDPAYAGLRRLQSLPVPVGRALFSWLMRSPARKAALQGSFAITSLGNSAVKGFLPIIGATITFGIGTIEQSAVVVDGQVVARPMLPVTMAFDHRVLDGAVAAEVLTDLKQRLESIK